MLTFLFRFVSIYSILEFVFINAIAELIKYVSVKFLVKIDDQIQTKLDMADNKMRTNIEAIDEADND